MRDKFSVHCARSLVSQQPSSTQWSSSTSRCTQYWELVGNWCGHAAVVKRRHAGSSACRCGDWP